MIRATSGAASAGLAFLLLAGCATSSGMTPATLRASLTGLQVVPGPGDPDGSGTAEIRVNPAGAEICWKLYARGIDPASAAHVRRGAAGSNGPSVVPLTSPGADGQSEGCAPIDQGLAREMAGQSFNFHVSVHNAAFPEGAIRGQLRGELGRLRIEERR